MHNTTLNYVLLMNYSVSKLPKRHFRKSLPQLHDVSVGARCRCYCTLAKARGKAVLLLKKDDDSFQNTIIVVKTTFYAGNSPLPFQAETRVEPVW